MKRIFIPLFLYMFISPVFGDEPTSMPAPEPTTQVIEPNIIKVYDVNDLIMEMPKFVLVAPSTMPIITNPVQEQKGIEPDQQIKTLVSVIEKTIEPGIWQDQGGTATISTYNGCLIVSAPQSVQDLISKGK